MRQLPHVGLFPLHGRLAHSVVAFSSQGRVRNRLEVEIGPGTRVVFTSVQMSAIEKKNISKVVLEKKTLQRKPLKFKVHSTYIVSKKYLNKQCVAL